jgi:hypothetical protein
MGRADQPATRADLDRIEGELVNQRATLHDFGLRLDDFGVKLEELRATFHTFRADIGAGMESLERRLTFQIGDAAARVANVVVERFTDMFRAGDDRTTTLDDRVTVLERRIDEHVADRGAHRSPARRR